MNVFTRRALTSCAKTEVQKSKVKNLKKILLIFFLGICFYDFAVPFLIELFLVLYYNPFGVASTSYNPFFRVALFLPYRIAVGFYAME